MLARHRQSLILQAVRSDGSARVSDLTQQLGVSDMTIRRDLEVLSDRHVGDAELLREIAYPRAAVASDGLQYQRLAVSSQHSLPPQ